MILREGASATFQKVDLFFAFYLRSPEPAPVGASVDPLGLGMGARVFPETFPTLGAGTAPVVPGVLHVGVLFTDEPTDGATDEPTDGATTDPPP